VSSIHPAPRRANFSSARAILLSVALVGLCCVAFISHRSASSRISALEQGSKISLPSSPVVASQHHALSVEEQIEEGKKEMKDLEAKVAQVREQQNSVHLNSHDVLVDKSSHEQLALAPQTDSYLSAMDQRTSRAVASTSDAISSALTADQLAAKKALKAAILAEKFKLRAQQKEKSDMAIVQRARERELEDQKEERKAEMARKIADRVAAIQRAKAAKDVVNRLKMIVDADIAKTRKDKADEESAERAAMAAQHTADVLSATDENVVRSHSKLSIHRSNHVSARHTPVDSSDNVLQESKHSQRKAASPIKHSNCDPLSGWAETLC
jgi:predicted nucleic acid-binding protein